MIKLLIVDDEGFVRSSLINNILWSELGVDYVEQADDGVNALEKASELKPEILLTDIRMPRMDGIELASRIKEILPACKIIFLTAYSDKAYLKSAIDLQAVSYLEKPIDLAEVNRCISNTVLICKEEENKQLENLAIKKTLNESMRFIQNNIALELIHHKFNRELVEAWLDSVGMEMPTGSGFNVIICRFGHDLGVNDEINSTIPEVLETVGGIFSENNLNCLTGYKDNYHIIGIVFSKYPTRGIMDQNTLKRACMTTLHTLSKNFDVFINIGLTVNNMEKIYESYQSAANSDQMLFFKGFNNLAFWDEPETEAVVFNEAQFNDFDTHLANDDKDNSIKFIRNLTECIRPYQKTTINYIKNIYVRLVMHLANHAGKLGMNLFSNNTDNSLAAITAENATLDGIEESIIKLMELYYRHMKAREDENKVVSDIIKIIAREYVHHDLSIISISEKLYLSRAHICSIFKKETGKTINTYITEYRMERAKELLADGKTKLFEVAVRTGYRDHNYFTKIFKKMFVITPSEYRRKYAQ